MPASDDALKRLTETLHLYREVHDRSFETLNSKIEDLAVQVSHLTSSVDRMASSVDRMAAAVERQTTAIDGHLAVAQQQSANIAELTKLVSTQAATVNTLINRIAA
ncbi:hypothetical protein ACN4EG_25265 [Alkalinema pantanalense CENA528]|uniref:hypothetical protein n=1 Tax=Alkalinema pantanalense TaxID=1620705 RepID=UPI003D6F87A2